MSQRQTAEHKHCPSCGGVINYSVGVCGFCSKDFCGACGKFVTTEMTFRGTGSYGGYHWSCATAAVKAAAAAR